MHTICDRNKFEVNTVRVLYHKNAQQQQKHQQ